MSAESTLSEALARIEHKVDLVLKEIQSSPFNMVGADTHICPVCDGKVSYYVNIFDKVIVRTCGCTTGKQPPIDLSAFAAPPPQEKSYGREGNEEDPLDPRRGPRRR